MSAEISSSRLYVLDISDVTFYTSLPRFEALSTDLCLRMLVELLLHLSIDADASGRRVM